ncbi:MAG TPA: hypothetical protein VM285_01070 [Polyangia bacterium]|nr:hypothetical protein [Polyangia bacterium]
MIRRLRHWARRLTESRPPDVVIGDPAAPYMRRWWAIPRNRVCNVYVHKVLRPDDDRAPHDHPWVNVSIVLAGSYFEVTPKWSAVRMAGDIVFRWPRSLHRLANPYPGTLTLFITGPTVREWGFQCPNRWVPWREFVKPGAPGEIGRGCGED